ITASWPASRARSSRACRPSNPMRSLMPCWMARFRASSRRLLPERRRMKPAVKIAPSILAADLARLGEQVAEAERCGAHRIHVDVMDGHFVPNLSFGAVIVEALRPVTRLPLEVHLMITDPDAFFDEFAAAGADSFLVHWEGNNNLHRTLQRAKGLKK